MGQLEGKVAIVTGAAGGFGEAIARLFVAEGARVLIADLDREKAQKVAGELGDKARAVHCDVSKGEEVRAAVAACVAGFGPPDIVVNNAGTTHRNRPMLEVDEATFDRVFAVNVKSIYHMAQAVVPLMRERRRGVILNIGSTAGIRPRPGLTWYNASKSERQNYATSCCRAGS
jgi:3-oxoacyl-[acyl-carrier protein] reductase